MVNNSSMGKLFEDYVTTFSESSGWRWDGWNGMDGMGGRTNKYHCRFMYDIYYSGSSFLDSFQVRCYLLAIYFDLLLQKMVFDLLDVEWIFLYE